MIQKISIGNIIEFRRKSDKSKVTFINALKKVTAEPLESGGNYWRICSSTIGNCFRRDNKALIHEKIEDVIQRRDKAKAKHVKDMYERNIAILNSFEDYDFAKLKPKASVLYLPKPKNRALVNIKGIPVQVTPNYIYSFKELNIDKIGAIWLVVKLDGFDTTEIALFTDALFRYLKLNYKKFEIAPDYCLALDLKNKRQVKYVQIQNEKVNSDLDSILEKIKKLL